MGETILNLHNTVRAIKLRTMKTNILDKKYDLKKPHEHESKQYN